MEQAHNGCIGHPVTNLLMQGVQATPAAAPQDEAEGLPDAAADAVAEFEAFCQRAASEYEEHAARAVRIEAKLDAILTALGVQVEA